MNNFVHVQKVAIPNVDVYEDVIKENQDELVKVRFQYFVHETLEGIWGIAKDKRYDQEFIMSFMSFESSIHIFLLHLDMVITGV
jgi:hypothetical protein